MSCSQDNDEHTTESMIRIQAMDLNSRIQVNTVQSPTTQSCQYDAGLEPVLQK